MSITTHDQYREYLSDAALLMEGDPAPDTEAGTRLLALVALIEAYEREHYPEFFRRERHDFNPS